MSPILRAWLRAPGSLSRRLAATGRHFAVQTLLERRGPALPGERAALGHPTGALHVRVVVLRVDGQVCVVARSVTPAHARCGPWKSLGGLGSRPLAHVLFDDPRIVRSALQPQRHALASTWGRAVARAWRQATGAAWPAMQVHARASVFRRGGQPLRVFEAFAPAAPPFSAAPDRRRCLRTARTRPSG